MAHCAKGVYCEDAKLSLLPISLAFCGAGMSFQQILASLTTNSAERFSDSAHRGRIANGMVADLVVPRADPEHDATAFSKVRYTILSGKIIYSEK